MQLDALLKRNFVLPENIGDRDRGESRVAFKKALYHILIFFREDAAGRVHKPAAWLHQLRSGGKDARLFGGQLSDSSLIVPAIVIGVAPLHVGESTERVGKPG